MIDLQRVIAGACAVAGVAILAGPGWALLAAAVLLFTSPTSKRVSALTLAARDRLVVGWRWLVSSRAAVAKASMPAGVIVASVGVFAVLGAGFALIAIGGALAGLSLLLGWNQ
jgi:hypothetical protein